MDSPSPAEGEVPLYGVLHLEHYVSSKTGDAIHLVCWCELGAGHTYGEWVIAGRPSTSGDPDDIQRERRPPSPALESLK